MIDSPDILQNHIVQCQSNVSHSVIDTNLGSILNNSDYYPKSSNIESSGDNTSNNTYDYNLKFNLVQWSVEFGITEKAVSLLLLILHNSFQELPNDQHTLCQTKSVTPEGTISGGQYYHFSVEKGTL